MGLGVQAGKLKFFGTRPNWVVSYIAYTKFHSRRPVFHSPGQIFTHIGERASASFPAWGLAYLLFCAAYWSRQPRVFRHLSHSCNLLWPSGAIWWIRTGLTELTHCGLVVRYGDYRSESTLAQVMACWLAAPSHNSTNVDFVVSEILWLPPKSNFTAGAQATSLNNQFEIILLEKMQHVPGANELTHGGLMTYIYDIFF